MSRTHLTRLLATILLAGVLAWSSRTALAGVASVEELLAGALTPSSSPALLGPIASSGRVGWECKPERAAAAAAWHQAGLPSEPGSP